MPPFSRTEATRAREDSEARAAAPTRVAVDTTSCPFAIDETSIVAPAILVSTVASS